MDFDYTTETIIPDSTRILTIGGTGALELPAGNSSEQPIDGVSHGALRWNTTTELPEFYNGSAWGSFAGSLTSVNLSSGAGISVSGGPITSAGTITVNNTGVLSFSGGTTGLTPATDTTGVITLSGVLSVANGGTGQSTYTNGQILIGNTTGSTLTKSTLTQGTGISITNGNGSITIANNGVISVFGRTGSVTAQSNDYAIGQLSGVSISSPISGQLLSYNGTNWVNSNSGAYVIYSLNNATPTTSGRKIYTGVIETSGSTVDFHITDNGTASGTALFTGMSLTNTVFSVTIQRSTTSDSQAPWGYVDSIINTSRTVRVNIKRSNTGGILLGGSYQGNLSNNNAVTVYLIAIGP